MSHVLKWFIFVCLLMTGFYPLKADVQPNDKLPSSRPVNIDVGIYLLKVYDINTVDETFSIDGYLTYSWVDDRLKFDSAVIGSNKIAYFNDRLDDIASSEIWVPHLEFINTSGSRDIENRSLMVHSDGLVKYVERFHAVLKQHLEYHKFPFDQHELKIQIEPFARNFDEVRFRTLSFEKASGVKELEILGWEILNRHTHIGFTEQPSKSEHNDVSLFFPLDQEKMRPRVHERYAHVECALEVKRNPGFYIWQLLFPLAILILSSVVILWIDDFATQIGIGFTLMLTVVAFNFFSESLLPALPYNTFIEVLIMLGYLYLLICIFVMSFLHRLSKSNKKRSEKLLKRFRIIYPITIVGVSVLSIFLYFGNWIIKWMYLHAF